MNVNIASEIYHEKYGMLFTFEYYMELLKNGVQLLQNGGLEKKCDSSESRAMNLALEYSNEEMLAALFAL